MNLSLFNTAGLYEASTDLFSQLGIKLNSNTTESLPVRDLLKHHFREIEIFKAIEKTFFIGIIDDSVFQATGMFDERYSYKEAILQADKNYEGLMLFALQLSKHPTRTEISDITRAFNRISHKMPVGLILKYQNESEAVISISISERFKYLQHWRQGEKAGKVIILRDILSKTTHAGHERILLDLVRPASVTNYAQLHEMWLQVLDVNILNKKFFQELANWYFWAMDNVQFPDDIEKKKDIRNATNLIRLITRVVFIWFIKEKSLVPDNLFNKGYLEKILKDFNKNKKSANYYQAILQNLFFGTLNQKMDERAFSEDHNRPNKLDQGIKNKYRYADKFSISKLDVVALFKNVPFFNGGLFDCLDKFDEEKLEKGKKEQLFVDGFSRLEGKQAIVPDFLFFGEVREVDLTEYYNPKAKKAIIKKVKGLISILNHYKFTVTENTPLEEEIALDPELLGKVFENLLASYNPETQTTARKQTGSFYTPREIVNYMVDESLMEYLKQKVQCNDDDFHNRLRDLFAYNVNSNPFNATETDSIIEAINSCKILDPACGSGAFPMGALHKMVHLLQKLDPNNAKWKAQQKEKIIGEQIKELEKDKIAIQGLNDNAVRVKAESAVQERLKEIDDIFESKNNFDDYARKLYLIENCIYGIDIQPIAVQISKLRCFISLIIDQDKDFKKDNLGFRSLPNLETKFVAANTLISLDKPQIKTGDIFIQDTLDEIKLKSEKLKEIRHSYFNAKLRNDKLFYQSEDKKLRKSISEHLVKIGHSKGNAFNIATFDPYDQNHFANWFEPEWMFGNDVKNGFDIVIGNPPYGANFTDSEKQYFKTTYKYQNYQPESYLFFTERSFDFLKINSVLSFIIPNTWLTNLKLINIRKFLTSYNLILNISHYHKSVFDAVVDTEVVIFKKGFVSNNLVKVFNHIETNIVQELLHNQNNWKAKNGDVINIFTNETIEKLVEKLKINSTVLSAVSNVYAGVVPYEEGKGTPPQTRKMINDRVYNSDRKVDSTYRKVLRGSDINKYENNWDGKRWVKYGENLAAPRKEIIFNNPKLIVRQTGDSLIATYDDSKFISFKNTHIINQKSEIDLKYLLALINSPLLNFYFQYLNPETGEALAEVKKETVEKLLIKKIKNQKPFITLVDKILSAKTFNPKILTISLENQLNEMIYKLYELSYYEVKLIDPGFWLSEAEYDKITIEAAPLSIKEKINTKATEIEKISLDSEDDLEENNENTEQNVPRKRRGRNAGNIVLPEL